MYTIKSQCPIYYSMNYYYIFLSAKFFNYVLEFLGLRLEMDLN